MKAIKKIKNKKSILSVVTILAIALLVFFLLSGKLRQNNSTGFDLKNIAFDAEEIQGGNFVKGESVFNNAQCQSQEEAYKGKYSCKCTADQIYGMTTIIPGVKKKDQISVKLYTKFKSGNARIVFDSKDNNYYFSKEIPFTKDWTLFEVDVKIPDEFEVADLKIFAYLESETGSVYFDEMNISVQSEKQAKIEKLDASDLNIRLTSSNYKKITSKRKEALSKGLLFSSKADLVDAFIKIDKNEYGAKIRLKGDLLDHLNGEKWSFRIQLKDNEEWNDMRTFSIHNSQARSHVSEWVMHQLFKDEGIITPAYDFLNVKLNEKKLGVYAFEQHFDNNLLKVNRRNIGPILRHNDDAYWDNVQDNLSPFPWSEATTIDLYNKENWKQDEFKQLFHTGQNMLNAFLGKTKTVREVFDLNKIAKYYALIEISHATHAQQLTNIRFYLDPTNGLLEPIGFDCFGDHLPEVTKDWTSVGEGMSFNNYPASTEWDRANTYNRMLFQDTNFYKKYISYLYKFTSEKYLSEKQEAYKEAIDKRVAFIKSDKTYKDYNYSWNKLFKKAKFTRDKILPRPNLSLQAFRIDNSKTKVELLSYHYFPIEIIGTGDKTQITEFLKKKIVIEGYKNTRPIAKKVIETKNEIEFIYFKTLGIDSLFKIKLSKHSAPNSDFDLVHNNIDNLKKHNFIKETEDEIYILSGHHTIDHHIYIPENKKLVISADTHLEFVNEGGIISRSPIEAIGSKKQPITFSGKNNGGYLLIINNSKKSIFENCQFIGLNKISHQNYQTNAAITLNKSEASFSYCVFINTKSKYAILNQNGTLNVTHSNFKNCKSALKSDYAVLYFMNNNIEEIYNNAFNIKSGKANFTSNKISNCFGSAFNVIENASIYSYDLTVDNAHKVIYTKSHAQLDFNKLNINNIEKGFDIFSKSEPHTTLTINNFTKENVKNLFTVQPMATLRINGHKKTTR